MPYPHPFVWLTESARKRAFIVCFILTISIIWGLQVLGAPLRTEAAPAGIVSFEFAGTLAVARNILDSWGETGRLYAGLNIGLDYLFLLAYAATLGLACTLLAGSLSKRLAFMAIIGVTLAWLQLGAAVLDATENYALIQMLLGSDRTLWPVVAKWCAVPKFLFVAGGLVYAASGAILRLIIR